MTASTTVSCARVNARGAARWTRRGHPWIYRTDVLIPPAAAGATVVEDEHGHGIGMALASRTSAIALRMLTGEPCVIDRAFWEARLRRAVAFRTDLAPDATAFRVVHAEADGLPSLIVDRYGEYLVVQLLSAGIEAHRDELVDALVAVAQPAGILARNDVPVRRHEQLPRTIELLAGDVPETVPVREAGIRFLATPWSGQKTGAFLDQRANRERAGELSRGRALDAFTYHGAFALHLARKAREVVAVDTSADALERADVNARLNGVDNLRWVEASAFDFLRAEERAGRQYDVIVLDPPAFAKRRDALERAIAGYKEINLRAMRLLAPGGHLLTFSCSYHVSPAHFRAMLEDAAVDAGRPLRWIEWRSASADHPWLLNIPETGYLKGAILQAAH